MRREHLGTRRAFLFGLLATALLPAARDLAAAEPPADPRVDAARLNKVVEESIAHLNEKGARWTAITQVKQRGEVRVHTVQFAGQRKSTVSAHAGGEDIEVFELVERDGVWYAKEKQGVFGKYRPYEVPFFLSTAYLFLERAELLFAPADVDSLGVLECVEDGVARFRETIDEETEALLRETLSQIDALAKDLSLSAEQQAKRKALQDLLKHGLPLEISLATGILTEYGAPALHTRIEDFAWLDSVPKDAFAVKGEYPDFTSDPTDADLNECVMIAHGGAWQPSMGEKGDADARLLDLKTGALRRIPFLGPVSLPGCFLKDRKRVVVHGMVTGYVGFGVYEIDLSTGENRQLGAGALEQGFWGNPCVSPDGKLIAVRRLSVPDPTLPSQIYVVELESGNARKIGEVVGGLHLSWMPDGKHILMMREEFADWDKPSDGTICTMAPDGTVEDICPGEWPVLLGGDRIMFTPRTGRVWHTCNLEGGDVKILGNGLRDYGFPTASPDGTRLLMMRFGTARGPRPTIIKIGDSRGKEAVRIGGLWAWPVWQ